MKGVNIMNQYLAINQLEQIRKENMNGDMKSQRIAAINFGIRAIKKTQCRDKSFWYGYLTCLLMTTLFLVAFNISMRS